ISLIEENCIEKKKWISHEDMMNVTVIAESTPGPIAINCATFIGYKQAGFWGAVLSTIAVVLPSFFIVLFLMIVLKNMLENKYVRAILQGVKPCMIGIIFATGMYMILINTGLHGEKSIDIRALLITLFLFLLSFLPQKIVGKKLSSMNFIMLSAVFGIVFYGF
ncbi:MAG TPA: chromate transporter, partial [Fusobacterium sp.]|uniref:chromate transporter n=1 Tax=Fusobacterium sp. TaxID=68766 RepID=UPI002F420738